MVIIVYGTTMKFQVRSPDTHDMTDPNDFDIVEAPTIKSAVRKHFIDDDIQPEYGGTITSEYEAKCPSEEEWQHFEVEIYQPVAEISVSRKK